LKSLCQARCAKVGIGRCAIPTEEDIAGDDFDSSSSSSEDIIFDAPFGYGCYRGGACSCEPDECNKELCELKGKDWIVPGWSDLSDSVNGCSQLTRCKEICSVAPTVAPTGVNPGRASGSRADNGNQDDSKVSDDLIDGTNDRTDPEVIIGPGEGSATSRPGGEGD